MTQAERLKNALMFLKEKGIDGAGNYQKIARKMGYNPNYISDIVNGRFAISEKFADRFQEAFSISKEWLLTGNGDMTVYPTNYPVNQMRGNIASDIIYTEKYLQIERENSKMMREYSDIIQTLQIRISNLVEQQISLLDEASKLKKRIKELEGGE